MTESRQKYFVTVSQVIDTENKLRDVDVLEAVRLRESFEDNGYGYGFGMLQVILPTAANDNAEPLESIIQDAAEGKVFKNGFQALSVHC